MLQWDGSAAMGLGHWETYHGWFKNGCVPRLIVRAMQRKCDLV